MLSERNHAENIPWLRLHEAPKTGMFTGRADRLAVAGARGGAGVTAGWAPGLLWAMGMFLELAHHSECANYMPLSCSLKSGFYVRWISTQ